MPLDQLLWLSNWPKRHQRIKNCAVTDPKSRDVVYRICAECNHLQEYLLFETNSSFYLPASLLFDGSNRFQINWDRDNKRMEKLWNVQKHVIGHLIGLSVTGGSIMIEYETGSWQGLRAKGLYFKYMYDWIKGITICYYMLLYWEQFEKP